MSERRPRPRIGAALALASLLGGTLQPETLVAAGAGAAAAAAMQGTSCEALRAADFSTQVGAAVTISTASQVEPSSTLPAYCRIRARIAPRNEVEIRLPARTQWSGRLLMAGCGGLCGSIQMERTDDALARGYAVAHTDMGHAESDLSFANDPRALEDFVHRSTHVATRLLKAVAKTHYGRPQRASYFRGCSTGGRQGVTAALMHPEDFDGIIAGAPAAGPAVPNIAWALRANTRRDGSSILDARAIGVLHSAVLAACDLDDGTRDGIVGDPPACRFEPRSLACGESRAAAADACLSAEQVAAAQAIYRGHRDPAGIASASMGYARGGEQGWLRTLVAGPDGRPPGLEGVAKNYLQRFEDLVPPPRTLADLDWERVPVRLAPVDAWPSFGPDGRRLDAFRRNGGKLLLYHSWADDSLTPATAVDVYTAHERAFGGRAALDPFFRLFMIPGMFHCRGGPGPDAVDFLSAIEAWVERGEAPQQLVALKPRVRVSLPAEYRFPMREQDVELSRRLLPYRPRSR